ncbi:hypothetical protein A447_00215 [Fusobacterium vincentii ATCC 51190]|uniref:Uncharacterized protein n=1 Tax=Fusobacterium vincentii TaxID=155615 RepID=A0AAJ1CUJ8_FUSVC|nr:MULTISPECIES: hypothetical protein [Fusobacterium]ETT03949.1 hypothetical protein HMPREF1497_1966 [Fusobacterium sp. CM21]EJG10196.1 hypothetical protein A447_00215 [Fusobacterium vincentii ATCC 51190]ERT44315.1 hypothetical protein HMPREF1768_01968 [Fusobacterium nucleatum CTI-7]MCW0264581.1 hypothetical protein [Fusobacterium vincentii]OHU81465.1 hypothetical protein BKN39_08350 [Fusobacterium nucleatum]
MSDKLISRADLSLIERSLSNLAGSIDYVNNRVDQVDDNVKIVYNEVEKLANEFREYVEIQSLANRKAEAKMNLSAIRDKLKDNFGHYDVVRRTATGILQANDLAIVKSSMLSHVTEKQMIETPNYWLTPCLVALAAWINDDKALAERALAEGIRRNDEKTSLFFGLICRRIGRENSSLKWFARYLEAQDEEKLDRKAVIVLDAFASGLLGNDTENFVYQQIQEWMSNLEAKPGFTERQLDNWKNAINSKRVPLKSGLYPYLEKYSNTWGNLQDVLEGANLNNDLYEYFKKVFEQKEETKKLKVELDKILDSLVTEFDEEELPLKREEQFEELVVRYNGSESKAHAQMALEKSVYDDYRDFMQLLTDASMNPEESKSSVATQKFATALSRNNIVTAFNDIVAQNRMNVPYDIEINVDTFNDKTQDGEDEEEVLNRFENLVEQEKQTDLSKLKLNMFEQFCLYGGAAVILYGIIKSFMDKSFAFITIILGIGLIIYHFTAKQKVQKLIQKTIENYAQKLESGKQIIRATIAEIVDFRIEFTEKDAESKKVLDFFEQIKPEEYIRRLTNSERKII